MILKCCRMFVLRRLVVGFHPVQLVQAIYPTFPHAMGAGEEAGYPRDLGTGGFSPMASRTMGELHLSAGPMVARITIVKHVCTIRRVYRWQSSITLNTS